MIVAKVVGNVWATRKHPDLKGYKLLLVKPVSPDGAYVGATTLAVDGGFGAGVGDTVLVLDEGGSARKVLKNDNAPVRTLVCGVLDSVHTGGKDKKYA
ncbi:MAG TPA: EutN/CcmL family microcompartment protein [Elusimicrobiales bacterium]|nr:EutN/CcmL family microcompartment protein [Elusimicrobiales bacterium]